jgi:AraC-like DNA-binding protein
VISSLRPAPALRPFVKFYYQVDATLDAAGIHQPVPARSPEILEFMFATHYVVERLHHGTRQESCASALVGAQTRRRVNLCLRGRVDAFTIAFRPGGIAALFGVPSQELTDLDFDACDVLGGAIDSLRGELGEQSGIAERAQIVDRFLCARLTDFNHASAAITAAQLIHRCNGSIQIAQLAGEAGLGIRQFERRFRQEIGVAPKLYARIVRFEAALRLKSAQPGRRWSDIAYSLGYFDQMHMIHDFRRLSDETPTTIVDQLDMFVLPEVNSRQI